MASYLTHLECNQCGHIYSSREKQTTCQSCQSSLLARYGLCQFSQSISRDELDQRQEGIWRWHELLPVYSGQYRITLGEGDTPLVQLPRTANRLGLTNLYCKDESSNPAGTFSAREACVALAKAAELGITQIAMAICRG